MSRIGVGCCGGVVLRCQAQAANGGGVPDGYHGDDDGRYVSEDRENSHVRTRLRISYLYRVPKLSNRSPRPLLARAA